MCINTEQTALIISTDAFSRSNGYCSNFEFPRILMLSFAATGNAGMRSYMHISVDRWNFVAQSVDEADDPKFKFKVHSLPRRIVDCLLVQQYHHKKRWRFLVLHFSISVSASVDWNGRELNLAFKRINVSSAWFRFWFWAASAKRSTSALYWKAWHENGKSNSQHLCVIFIKQNSSRNRSSKNCELAANVFFHFSLLHANQNSIHLVLLNAGYLTNSWGFELSILTWANTHFIVQRTSTPILRNGAMTKKHNNTMHTH